MKARSPRPWVNEEGLWPEFAHAVGPVVAYSDACRGPSGPLNRTGLTPAVPPHQVYTLRRVGNKKQAQVTRPHGCAVVPLDKLIRTSSVQVRCLFKYKQVFNP